MILLLDENLNARLKPMLRPHEAVTVREMGWSGISNGQLLAAASGTFDVLITADKNLPHQQKVAEFAIAVIVLRARTNRLSDHAPLIPKVLEALAEIQPGQVVEVRAD